VVYRRRVPNRGASPSRAAGIALAVLLLAGCPATTKLTPDPKPKADPGLDRAALPPHTGGNGSEARRVDERLTRRRAFARVMP
jgi:hypothetical protein